MGSVQPGNPASLGMTGIPESIWESWEELLRTRWQGEQLMPIFHAYYFWFAWGRSSRTPKSTTQSLNLPGDPLSCSKVGESMMRFVSLLLLLAGLLLFLACGGDGAAERLPTATSTVIQTLSGALVTPTPIAPPEARVSIHGHWEGATLYQRRNLITMVDFDTGEEGLKGTLDFPEIGREGLVLSKVSFESSKVHFELSDFKTVFDGELKGDTISGKFLDPDGSGHFSLERR